MVRRIGLTPVPDDADVTKFLENVRSENSQEMEAFLAELKKTLQETENSGQPEVFAYGKMLNYLATEESVTQPWLINILAAALWELL
jgi:hypothetical protein